jgi:hypothetical protein
MVPLQNMPVGVDDGKRSFHGWLLRIGFPGENTLTLATIFYYLNLANVNIIGRSHFFIALPGFVAL